MLIQVIIFNLGATKAFCHENSTGAETAQLSLPRVASWTFQIKAELYQCLLSLRDPAFLQLFAETSFCQESLRLESLRCCIFQKHRSIYSWSESTDEFENPEMFNSFCFPELKQNKHPSHCSQAQMNHQQLRVYFTAKVSNFEQLL